MSYTEILTILKDLILTGAAVTGAVVAVKGLGTWRAQLSGQSEYDLSRRILVSLFKYRDSIDSLRHPMMWGHEMPSPPEEESETMSDPQIRFYGTSKAYQARWDKIQEQRSALYADLLEAEAIWGNELNTLFKTLFDLQHELLTQIRHYLDLIDPDTPETTKEAIRKLDENRRDIMYDNLSDEPDEYKRDFLNGISEIENYLKPKLGHRK